MHWLDETGGRYLDQVRSQQPRFLIEIEVNETEIETIFKWLKNFTGNLEARKERRLCVAVAAVNAAALAEEGDLSFIDVFYRRMGRQEWAGSWEARHASAIWHALRENFEIELQEHGPGKYVNSIYGHAGIPVRARPRFAAFLGNLLRSCGGAFTRRDYDCALLSYPDSPAKTFLLSPAGYKLTSYLAKWYGRHRLGVAADAELNSCWRELLASVGKELSRITGPTVKDAAGSRAYRNPYLALNLNSEQSRLEVRFDPRGVQKKVYAVGGRRVERNYKIADDKPIEVSIRGERALPVSPWWYPGETPFAVFRASSGALIQDPSSLRPGVYWVATTLDIGSHKEISLLDGPSCTQFYSIYEFEFRPGVAIPELGIQARSGVAAPALELVGGKVNNLGTNLYEEMAPSVRLLNWNPQLARRYLLWMNAGAGDMQVPIPQVGDEINIPVVYPASVEVWLEDIRNSGNDVIDHLSFAVIPRLSLNIEENTVGIDAVAHLRGNVPAGYSIEWEPGVAKVGDSRWRVNVGQKIIDGQLSGPGVRVAIAVRIRRTWLRETNGTLIFWKETLAKPDREFRLEGPPETRYSLMVSDSSGRRLVYQGLLDASGVSTLKASSFNDGVQMDYGSAMELIIGLDTGHQFTTGLFVASAACLDRADEADLRRLPDIGEALAKCRSLKSAKYPSLDLPVGLLASPIRQVVAELACGTAVFDETQISQDFEVLAEHCAHDFLQAVEWYKNAAALSDRPNTDVTHLLESYPAVAVERLLVDRWRQIVTDLRARLHASDEIPAEDEIPAQIDVWRNGRKSGIEIRDGGRKLTEAVRLYSRSFDWPEAQREVAYNNAYKRLFDLRSLDPVVLVLAESFRRILLYRMGGADAEVRNPLPFDFPPCFQRLQSTLDSLRGLPDCKWVKGIGLREVSPVAADAELEYELGRPRDMAAGN